MFPLAMLSLTLMADPPVATEPKAVAATREEMKKVLENHKKARPRLPMPPPSNGPLAKVNNGRFREYYLPPEYRDFGLSRDPDSAMTLDPTFKVKLFWITSRTNNCYYCLGHQEHKLLAAGLTDDDIAKLDGNWAGATPAEKAAYDFTRRVSLTPQRVGPADIEALKKHYTPSQVLEIIVTVAGFNAMNRWTDGLNIPAEENGDFFKKGANGADLSTFRTPTAPEFARSPSTVAPLLEGSLTSSRPAVPRRPTLETRAQVEAALAAAATRKPLYALVEVQEPTPNWERLLRTFPVAMKGRTASLKAAMDRGGLSATLRAEIAWVAARHDRAWYALAVARDRLKALGLTDDQIFDRDQGKSMSEADRAALAVVAKLTVGPSEVTDADIEGLRAWFTDREVAEIVHQACNAAFFDRVTELAQLPLDR